MTPKITLHLSNKADEETRRRFFVAVDQITEVLKAGIRIKNKDEELRIIIGGVENLDVAHGVVQISVYEENRISTCKGIARLFLERNRVGDKYNIVMNPDPISK